MGSVEPSLWKPTTVWTVYGKWVASTALWSIRATMESTRIWSRVSLGFSSIETYGPDKSKKKVCFPRENLFKLNILNY